MYINSYDKGISFPWVCSAQRAGEKVCGYSIGFHTTGAIITEQPNSGKFSRGKAFAKMIFNGKSFLNGQVARHAKYTWANASPLLCRKIICHSRASAYNDN
jgi:hypothetical protein